MEIKNYLESCLNKRIPSHIFLDRMRFSDDNVRKSFSYNDFTYVPSYYWLGNFLKPKVLIEIGFRLGLFSSTFLKACKTVEYFLAIQEPVGTYYSPRLGVSNVKDNYRKKLEVYTGNIEDEFLNTKIKALAVDLVFINEETSYDKYRFYFDLVWPQITKEGYLIIDCVKKYKSLQAAVKDFCLSNNIEAVSVDTTYGLNLIRKA